MYGYQGPFPNCPCPQSGLPFNFGLVCLKATPLDWASRLGLAPPSPSTSKETSDDLVIHPSPEDKDLLLGAEDQEDPIPEEGTVEATAGNSEEPAPSLPDPVPEKKEETGQAAGTPQTKDERIKPEKRDSKQDRDRRRPSRSRSPVDSRKRSKDERKGRRERTESPQDRRRLSPRRGRRPDRGSPDPRRTRESPPRRSPPRRSPPRRSPPRRSPPRRRYSDFPAKSPSQFRRDRLRWNDRERENQRRSRERQERGSGGTPPTATSGQTLYERLLQLIGDNGGYNASELEKLGFPRPGATATKGDVRDRLGPPRPSRRSPSSSPTSTQQ